MNQGIGIGGSLYEPRHRYRWSYMNQGIGIGGLI